MRQRYPTDYKADLCLGYVAAEAGHPVEAKAHYLAALKNHPASMGSLVALADLQIQSKLQADATGSLFKAIDLGDNRPAVHYNYLLALMPGGDQTSIRATLKSAIAEYPSDEQINHLLDRFIKQTVSQ